MHPEILNNDYVFTFGRHRGRRLSEVDAGYIAWCRQNIEWFRLAYDRMTIGNTEAVDTGLSTEEVDEVMDITTDGVREVIKKVKEIVVEPDISWFERTGGDFIRGRGRV